MCHMSHDCKGSSSHRSTVWIHSQCDSSVPADRYIPCGSSWIPCPPALHSLPPSKPCQRRRHALRTSAHLSVHAVVDVDRPLFSLPSLFFVSLAVSHAPTRVSTNLVRHFQLRVDALLRKLLCFCLCWSELLRQEVGAGNTHFTSRRG